MIITQIYSRIPDPRCKGLCAAACGPIPAFTNEPIVALTQPEDITRAGNEAMISRHVAHLGRGSSILADLICPHLQDGRCAQYESRPAICRMFGSSMGMECPFGCVPDRWLSRKEAAALLKQVRDAEPIAPR